MKLSIMAMVMVALLAALWAGLVRIGWGWPALRPLLPALHGPLMVSGFLGTLISLERAVALRKQLLYLIPMATGVGAVWLIIGFPLDGGQLLMVLGSLGLTAVSLYIFNQQRTLYTAVMGLGALCWLVGNGLWMAGWSVHRIVFWWAGFLILTIVGERLELSRVQRLGKSSYWWFGLATAVFLGGLLLSVGVPNAGVRLGSLGVLALSTWLLRFDIARRTARQSGITGYIGQNLLIGYGWLLVGGLAGLVWGQMVAGPHYDLWLHTLFLGFAFGMIFAHALIIVPAITGLAVPFHWGFYVPVLLLHGSLLLRTIGDLLNPGLRQWGGLLNAAAILLFFGMVAAALRKSRTAVANTYGR